MSEQVAAMPADDALRIRKERVHTMMLIELLALLVFMAMAFAFVLKEEGDRVNPWKEKFDAVSAQLLKTEAILRRVQADNRTLRAENEQLEAYVRRLLAAHDGPLPANDERPPISEDQYKSAMQKVANSDQLIDELQRENAALRVQLGAKTGKGGGLPKCTVTAGMLLSIDLLGDGRVRARAVWQPGADQEVRRIDGIAALAAGGPFNEAQFRANASRVHEWGLKQNVPCVFSVEVHETHGNLGLYKRQLALVDGYFYVRRR